MTATSAFISDAAVSTLHALKERGNPLKCGLTFLPITWSFDITDTLNAVIDTYSKSNELEKVSLKLCNAIVDLFDEPLDSMPTSLSDIVTLLQKLQKDVDLTVNNSSSTRTLDVRIRITRGHFIFGLPRLLSQHLPSFSGVLVVYLLDEFENLTESQQKYINTLIRERKEQCTFKVDPAFTGSKHTTHFPLRRRTRRGSEYEVLPLDAKLREQKEYSNFARLLCKKDCW